MAKFIDYTGQRFGRLVVVCVDVKNKWGNYKFKCLCDCGNIKIIESGSLKKGKSTSCGCFRNEQLIERSTKHNGSNSSEYKIWTGIKTRCYNPNDNRRFNYYGARGITVCKRWLDSFENFYADMGERPSKQHSIDRINNDQGYSPENCKWATQKEQKNNTRHNRVIEINGIRKTKSQWDISSEFSKNTFYNRKKLGWCDTCALTNPINIKCTHVKPSLVLTKEG